MAKLKRRKCKSIKEFRKILRKYAKYAVRRENYKRIWYIWLSVDVIGLEALKGREMQTYIKSLKCRNLSLITEDVISHYGHTYETKKGIFSLVGIEITNEDYYYVYEKVGDKTERLYNTCVGAIESISSIY